MTDSLDATYFDGVFADDDDPWGLASSPYEAAKFDRTTALLCDRRYGKAIEIGCAHGVLTQRIAPLCDDLLSIDISARAIALARDRAAGNVRLSVAGFPGDAPAETGFDLALMSEVAYYWNDADLARAAAWLRDHLAPGARIMLVHWTGETDYPQTGDDAVAKLSAALGDHISIDHAERTDDYRLDLWRRR